MPAHKIALLTLPTALLPLLGAGCKSTSLLYKNQNSRTSPNINQPFSPQSNPEVDNSIFLDFPEFPDTKPMPALFEGIESLTLQEVLK